MSDAIYGFCASQGCADDATEILTRVVVRWDGSTARLYTFRCAPHADTYSEQFADVVRQPVTV